MWSKPLLVQFTNLLHACRGDCRAPAVKEFLEKHKNDQTFQARARAVIESFQMKQEFDKGPAVERKAILAPASSVVLKPS
jgi:hypothetical protein